jgi:uncharacterized protein
VKRPLDLIRRVLAAPLLLLIALYRRLISPALPRRCRYEPTCSAYAEQAIRELGPARGTIVAGWRLLRCNPFSHGGIDDLADRRLFRDGGPAGHDHSHGAPA